MSRSWHAGNGFLTPLPAHEVSPETAAWRARLVAWIDEQRADTRNIGDLIYHCISCGADTPISDLAARRRSA